ncbi:hypothetical protein DLAC_06668 [Tieghemostelium lacteum]|uniref:DNA replication licensing factor MCM3 n=1 Tax=Tieghemostelium lacteum TaxID=361077 RepID=A0A151ZFC3_TIELA|nr:hypothetical protein DLAC_06668 [Tieghemostelium lacteum]|eukprot:KYQ92671.1 hypothetical protein DLAC_06668 [Tieghemostelium lacteum]
MDYKMTEDVDMKLCQSEFADFVNNEESGCHDKILELIDNVESKRIIISIDLFRNLSKELSKKFLSKPIIYMTPFQEQLSSIVKIERKKQLEKLQESTEDFDNDEYRKLKENENLMYFIGFEGSFGRYHVTPRGLNASFIGHMVCVEGIVTKCSLVRPKVMKSVHYCEITKRTTTRSYTDATSDSGISTTASYPTKDEMGNPLMTEYGQCEYKDSQMISIQEMPERAPAGQLPRSVDILLDNDLVDLVKPGDRVQVVGIYRAIPMNGQGQGGSQQTKFRTILICNSIKLLSKEVSGPEIGEIDLKNIKSFAKREDCFDLIASSLAPSIYGHEYIKKSLLLLLLGGVEQNLQNGTHLRGDINLLMVGDPSTAKSQLLRFVLNIAPLAINTTGRGSSGVGLTAAVTSDSETGERRLEAGAMVLADRGIVCIDEFDKMSHDDRVAIHEVMEQQTVTISKAGIHASLNARCSVVAAANPIYGQYNRYKKPHDNIGLPDSLLSRFDLLFIVLDNTNADHDRSISEHVLRMHMYRQPGTDSSSSIQVEQISVLGGELETLEAKPSDIDVPVFQKFDKLLHGSMRDHHKEIVAVPFIQKYIYYAKSRVKPNLSQDAVEFIVESFTELRSKEEDKTLPITTRTLETMIRLSQAHAKCRLSFTVDKRDAEIALEIMNFALFNEAKPHAKPIPPPNLSKSDATDEDKKPVGSNKRKTLSASNNDNETTKKKLSNPKKKSRDDPMDQSESEGEEADLNDDSFVSDDEQRQSEDEHEEKEEEEEEDKSHKKRKTSDKNNTTITKIKSKTAPKPNTDNNNINNNINNNNNNNNNKNDKKDVVKLSDKQVKEFAQELNRNIGRHSGKLEMSNIYTVLKDKYQKEQIDLYLQQQFIKSKFYIGGDGCIRLLSSSQK